MHDNIRRIDPRNPASARFAAQLQYEDIPAPVRDLALVLFVDWVGSALAGAPTNAARTIAAFARSMGPQIGASEVLADGTRTSPYFAAMANAVASASIEQHHMHDGSMFRPAPFVFSPALAVAQTIGASGHELLTASVAGCEVGIRICEYLGQSDGNVVHNNGTAGAVAAAVAAGRLLKLSSEQMLQAIRAASDQAAGLWPLLDKATDSNQLHAAHAAAAGLASAYLAKDSPAAMKSHDTNPDKCTDGVSGRWATAETSIRYKAFCRQPHSPAHAHGRISRDEISAKVQSLISFGGRTDSEVLVAKLWRIGELNRVDRIAS